MTIRPRVFLRVGMLALLGVGVVAFAVLGGAVLLRGMLGASPAGAASLTPSCTGSAGALVVDFNGVSAVTLTTSSPLANGDGNGNDRAIELTGAGFSTVTCMDGGQTAYVTDVTSIQVSSGAVSGDSLTVELANGPFGPNDDTAPTPTGAAAETAPCSIAIVGDGSSDTFQLAVEDAAPVPTSAGSGTNTTGVSLGTNGVDMEVGACTSPDLTVTPASYLITTSSSGYTLDAQGSTVTGEPVSAVAVSLTDGATGGGAVLIPGDPATGKTDTLSGAAGTTVDESGATSPVVATLGPAAGSLSGGYGGSGTVSLQGVGKLIAPTLPPASPSSSASFAAVTSGVTVTPTPSCTNGFVVNDTSPALSYTLCGFTDITGSGLGHNTMTAGSGTDTFTASGNDNTFKGGTGTDTFTGSGTGDTFVAGASGDETFVESGSADTIDFSAAPGGLVINDATGTASGTSASYTFSNGLAAFTTFIGPTAGSATFTAGPDTISFTGSGGSNTMIAGSGTDTFSASGGGNTFKGSTGTDTFTGSGTGDKFVAGASGDETFVESGSADTIDFSAAPGGLVINDTTGTASGTSASYTFSNGLAAFTIFIGPTAGSATFTAGPGTITFTSTSASGSDTMIAGSGTDTFTASGNDNTFKGGTGTDTFTGSGTGDKFVAGASGVETFVESGSADTIDFSAAPGGLVINDATGTASGTSATYTFNNGLSAFSTFIGPTAGSATFTAGPGTITFTSTSAGGSNTMIAGSGTDTFTASGNDNTFKGGTGTDTFTGSGTGDTFVAGASGVETFIETGSADTIDFSAAPGGLVINDATGTASGTSATYTFTNGLSAFTTFIGPTAGSATFTAGPGTISFTGSGGSNTMTAGSGSDTFSASGGGNTFKGSTGTDTFTGSGTGDKFVAGSSGVETFIESGSADTIDFSAAPGGLVINDATGTASGTSASYTFNNGLLAFTTFIGPTAGSATFTAGAGSISFTGPGGSNTMTAGSGTDTFSASGNDNTFKGGTGTDTFTGSGTGDKFVAGASGVETFIESGSADTIDFAAAPGGLVINDATGTASGTSATYTFNNGLSAFTTFIGPTAGSATFTAGPGTITFTSTSTSGSDTMIAGSGTDTFSASGNDNTFKGGTGTDTFTGSGTGDTFVAGRSGVETFIESGSADTIDFSAAPGGLVINDATGTASGTSASYTFSNGLSAFTTFIGPTAGSATFTAGPGTISFTGSGGSNTIIAGSGTDTFSASGNGNTFKGSTGTDTFTGSGTGDTFVAGSSGVETFIESGSADTIDFSAAPGGLVINDATGTASSTTGTSATYTFSNGLSAFTTFIGPTAGSTTFTAGAGTVTFTSTSASGSNTMTAGSGTDAFSASGNDNTFKGGTGTDTFTGSGTGDKFVAGASGVETFIESGSADTIDFSAAPGGLVINDATGTASGTSATYTFSNGLSAFTTFIGPNAGSATFTAGPGTISFTSTSANGSDTMIAGSGTDTFSASGGGNTFKGSTGTDTFTGSGTGDTFVVGRSGVETFIESGSADTIDFSAAPGGLVINDATGTASGTSASYTFSNGLSAFTTFIGPTAGSATFTAGPGAITFTGSGGSNTMTAGSGTDTFSASGGGNTFNGGTGTDTFTGSGTGDKFVAGASGDETFIESGSADTIDFSAAPGGLVINDTTGTAANGEAAGTAGVGGTAEYTFRSGLSTFTTLVGPRAGDATFMAGTGTGTVSILGKGASNTLDLSGFGAAMTVTMPTSSAPTGTAVSGATQVVLFTDISELDGTGHGDTVYVGTGSETLNESGGTNTLDFSDVPVGSSIDQGVDITVSELGGVITGAVTSQPAVGVTDSFTGFSDFNGTLGIDTFSPGEGDYEFDGCPSTTTGCASAPSEDVLNLSTTSYGQTVTLSGGGGGCSSPGALSGGTTCGTANNVEVDFSGVGTILGSAAGGTTFVAGSGTYTLTGQGSGGNELDLSGAPAGVTVSLVGSTNTVCGAPATGCGWGATVTFSNMQTVTGTPFNDVFLPGAANVTIGGCDTISTSPTACGDDTVSFAGAPAGVTVNLNTDGTATNPVGLATGGWGGSIALVGISNVIGTAFADTITGDALPGTLLGGGGNDTFFVTGGDDTIDGGTGNNTLSLAQIGGQTTVNLNDAQPQDTGAAGILTIVGGTIQTLVASAGGSALYAGTGNVTLIGGPGSDVLVGGSGTQTLEACDPSMSACGGNDVLVGGSGTQTLNGGSEPVTFEPGEGNETLGSTASSNTLSYARAPAGVLVNLSSTLFLVPTPTTLPGFSPITLPESGQSISPDTATGGFGGIVNLAGANITQVLGSPFSDVIVTSSSGGDQVNGGGGDDLLVAAGGNNVLTAAPGTQTFFLVNGAGNNVINGGGNSVIDEQLAPSGVDVNLQTGIASGGFGGSDSLTGVMSIIGSEFNDILVGNAPGGTIIGLNGNDLIEGGPVGGETLVSGGGGNVTFCASVYCQISGTNSSSLPGTSADQLIGGSGDDTFFVQNGVVDIVIGGSGFNEAQVDPGDKLTNITEILPPES